MSLNQRIVDNIVAIFQDVSNSEKVTPEKIVETVQFFYEGETLHYMDHMIAAWDMHPEMTPEAKIGNYLGFIFSVPVADHQKVEIQLDQLSNLIGVLTARELKIQTPIVLAMIQNVQNTSVSPVVADFLSAMLLEYSDSFESDRANDTNQQYLRYLLRMNQNPLFVVPEDGILNMYHYMNGFMLTRASFSLLNIENRQPYTFTQEDIQALVDAEDKVKDSTNANKKCHKSAVWNVALTHYVREHNNLEELRAMYEANPEKQQAWDEDLAIVKLSLYNSSEMSPS